MSGAACRTPIRNRQLRLIAYIVNAVCYARCQSAGRRRVGCGDVESRGSYSICVRERIAEIRE
jgi:hypothetical protein